jgi:hypothetical protein
MSNGIEGMGLREAIRLSRKPPEGRAFRIWHVRRDPEMMAAILRAMCCACPSSWCSPRLRSICMGRFLGG